MSTLIDRVLPKTTTARITWIWLASRALVFAAAAVGSLHALTKGPLLSTYSDLWFRWDTQWFDSIARFGYAAPYSEVLHKDFHFNVAFFPGFPLLMRSGAAVGISTTVAGLLISLVAGLFAAMALGRLTAQVQGLSEYGVLAWVAAPTAIFLAAAYTEALFCAFAFWAWTMGREHRWVWAGALAGAAALVRVNGLFLAVGLIVLFLTSGSRQWWRGLALLLPFVATAGYFAYLKVITGSWSAWSQAQTVYWKRVTVDPLTSLLNTYQRIFVAHSVGSASMPSRFVIEILAMALLTGACVLIFVHRWWGEGAYVLFTLISLGTSSVYLSVPRSAVVLFPVWMLLGLWMTRHRWFRIAYFVVAIPLLCYWTVRFTQGFWVS